MYKMLQVQNKLKTYICTKYISVNGKLHLPVFGDVIVRFWISCNSYALNNNNTLK